MWLPTFLRQWQEVLILAEVLTGFWSFSIVTRHDYPRLQHASQQVRLLHLLPEEGQPLRCNFSVAYLSDEPVYNALSYAWGETSIGDNFSISCGNQKLPITKNLHGFLQQHQSTVHVMPLWIDALCIDQTNEEEKSEQIAIMGKVYSQAFNVLIWLGKEDERTGEVLELASVLERVNRISKEHNLELDRQRCLDLIASTDIPAYDQPVWTALNDLLRRPYFKRLWVLQESVLAHSRLYLCGSYSFREELITATVPWLKAFQSDFFTNATAKVEDQASSEILIRFDWDALEERLETEGGAGETVVGRSRGMSGAEAIAMHTTNLKLQSDVFRSFKAKIKAKIQDQGMLDAGIDFNWDTFDIRQDLMDEYYDVSQRVHLQKSYTQHLSHLTGGKRVFDGESLVNLLRICRQLDATVAKDRVFALLGIADEAKTSKYGENALTLSYSLDMWEIFQQTTIYLIKTHRSLDVLKMVEYLPGFVDDTVLSWVPRWHVKEFARATILSGMDDETGFSADASIPLKLEKEEDPTRLLVQGQRVGRVVAVSKILSRYELYHGDQLGSMNIFDVWAHFQQTILPLYGMASYPTGEDIRKVFAMTVIAGLDENGRPASNEYWRDFLYQYAVEAQDQIKNRSFDRHWRLSAGFDGVDIRLLQEQIKGGSRAKFLGAFHRAAEHRRIFLTANGHLGLGPAAMEVDDQVAVLFGSNVPYIYRDPANRELLEMGYLGPFDAEMALDMIGVKNNTDERFDPHADFYLPPHSEDMAWNGELLKTTWPKVIIGHCYVHGMMHGEAVSRHQTGDAPGVVFTFG